MRRREFIALVGSGVVAWPLPGATQVQVQQRRRVGFLSPAEGPGANHAAFLRQLRSDGFEEGRNINIEWKWAAQRYDLLPQMAVELVERGVEFLVTQTQASSQAAQKATKQIPIVFVGVRDPIKAGLVASMNLPGGNITGVTLTPNWELPAKQVELLREIKPGASRFAVLWNPKVEVQAEAVEAIKAATKALEVSIQPFGVQEPAEIEAAFATIERDRIDGALTLVESFTLGQRALLAKSALASRVPTAFEVKDYVEAGGLLSYGLSYQEHYAQAGAYLAKVLNGAKPANLPILEPTKFELVINLKTAKALGITVPPSLLSRADEVIE